MLGWLASGTGAPITAFAIKFGLFNTSTTTTKVDEMGNIVSKSISLNGWGIVSIFLIAWTAVQILNEVIDSMNGYSLTKQVVNGVKSRIIPLVAAFFICYWLNGVVQQIMFCLGIVILSQLVAIPLNPLPQWKNKKKKQESYGDVFDSLIEFAKTKLKKSK